MERAKKSVLLIQSEKSRNLTDNKASLQASGQTSASDGRASKNNTGESGDSEDGGGGGGDDDDPSNPGGLCLTMHIVLPDDSSPHLIREILIKELIGLPRGILLGILVGLLLHLLGLTR